MTKFLFSIVAFTMLYQNYDYELYKNPKEGVQMMVPKSWEFMENPQAAFIFIEPLSQGDDFRENVNLIINSNEDLSLEEYTGASKVQMRSLLTGFKEIETKYITFNGLKASQVIYQHKTQGLEIQVYYYVVVKGDKAYNITFSTLVSSANTYQPVFEKMIKGFSIIN